VTTRRNHVSDIGGVTRLAFDATAGVTALVEAMHDDIARLPVTLAPPPIRDAVNGVTWLVYRSIAGVTRVAGDGVDRLLKNLAPLFDDVEPSPGGEMLLAALNGVLGDHLDATRNPLAIMMRLRRDGVALDLTRSALAASIPRPARKVVVFVHGLCMSDLQWARPAHCHATALERDLGSTAVYLSYNSGRHVSTNGRAMAAMLEALVDAWPVPLDEIAIVAHSMGGLVARSAHHYGTLARHRWPRRLRALVFLGTPHHGAPLERAGHVLHRLIDAAPWVGSLARLGKIRSAGITDLRHGNLVDEDWQDRDRFADGSDCRRPVPLPGVRCFTVAATLGTSANDLRTRLAGDGLVPLASALGRHGDPRFALGFPDAHQWVACETGHVELLGCPAVYRRIRGWLAD
jgi:hypothetical protein